MESNMSGGTTGSLSDSRFKILTFIIVVATLIIGNFFQMFPIISFYSNYFPFRYLHSECRICFRFGWCHFRNCCLFRGACVDLSASCSIDLWWTLDRQSEPWTCYLINQSIILINELFSVHQVLLVCGLGILVLGTAANIYAEEEYSETRAETVLPPSLKEIEAKFDLLLPQSSPPANMVDSFNRLGDKSFNDPLSFNRSAFGSGEFLLFFIVCVCPF